MDQQQEKDPNPKGKILKMPVGVDPKGLVHDPAQALFQAQMEIPELYKTIIEVLASLDASMSVVALYCEKKGLSDGILSQEDLEDDDDKPQSGEENDAAPKTN